MDYISLEGLEKIKKELEERKTIKRQQIAKQIEEAKELGDLSENAEYATAKEAQALNESRILQLEEIIKKVTLISPSKKGQKRIRVGNTVEVELLGKNLPKGLAKRQSLMIVGSQEARPAEGKISHESPLGRAFLDRQVNEVVEVETPRGKMKYKIKGIK